MRGCLGGNGRVLLAAALVMTAWASPAVGQPRVDAGIEEASVAGQEEASIAQEPEPPVAGNEEPAATFGEVVQVALATFVVRVVDASGEAVEGLGEENFLVSSGDERVRVVAVDWISSQAGPEGGEAGQEAAVRDGAAPGGAAREEAVQEEAAQEEAVQEEAVQEGTSAGPDGAAEPAAEVSLAPPASWIVLFVQADFNSLRVRGHLKFLPFVHRLLEALPAGDRVALVSFDSHLKLWKDFTTDHRAVADAVYQAMRFSNRPEPGTVAAEEGSASDGAAQKGPAASLAAHWDPEAARDAAWVEDGLRLVGEALEPLPGDKAVVFLGWGMGRYGSSGFRPRHGHYGPAVEALGEAGASVFVVDISDAAHHTLELGLRQVAADTGGTYQKTVEFPQQALHRLRHLLRGYYLVTVDADAITVGDLDLQLQGVDPGVRALIRPLRAVRKGTDP